MINWFAPSIRDTFRYVRVEFPSFEEREELTNITGGSIEENYLTTLKVSGSLDYFDGLEMPRDLVRVYYSAEDTETGEKSGDIALGTFFVSTPSSTRSNITDTGSADCYSILTVAADTATPTTYTVNEGVSPVTEAKDILTGLDLVVQVANTSTAALTRSMSWDAGTSWLEIVNDLLDAANFSSALVDGMGTVILKRYENPGDAAPVVTFEDDKNCIFIPEMSHEWDIWSVPNVVTLNYSTEEKSYSAVAINDSDDSPYSRASRGREISYVEEVNELAVGDSATDSQILNELQNKADAVLASKTSAVESYELQHVFYPYSLNDTIRIKYNSAGIDASMAVVKRSVTLDLGALVSTRVRRFVR